MNKEDIRKTLIDLLDIKKYEKRNFEINTEDHIYKIKDIEIKSDLRKVFSFFKNPGVTVEFWRCNFISNINLTNLEIRPTTSFCDCIFENFFTARSTVFENKIRFYRCIFENIFDCCGSVPTIFKKSVSFYETIFHGDVDFEETIFQAKDKDDNLVENSFRKTQFEGKCNFSYAKFSGRVNFSIARFQNEARFIETKFLAKALDNKTIENNFREAQFEGKTIFSGAEFSGRVNFSIARFQNEARFIETKFLAPATNSETIENNFREAQFGGNSDFCGAEFSGRVNFSIARFQNEARFIKAKFLAPATESKIIENDFGEAQFEGKTIFSGAEFSGRVNFSIARFQNEARFIKAKFLAPATESKIIENNFGEAQFGGNSDFSGVEFSGRVNFSIARFQNEARFIKAKFLAPATESKIIENDFRKAQFEGATAFNAVEFVGRVEFIQTEFRGGGNFVYMKLKNKIIFLKNIFQDFMFKDVCFERNVRFEKCTLRNTLFVNESQTKAMFNEVEFQDCVFKETNTFGNKVFLNKPLLTTNTFEGQFNIDQYFLKYDYEGIDRKNPAIWRDLFRRLKSNRLAHHNAIDALELHTQELYARELELELKSIQKEEKNKISFKENIEKWQLRFYRLTSEHHTNLVKIFNSVILLIALFGIFAYSFNVGRLDMSEQEIQKILQHSQIPLFKLFQGYSILTEKLPSLSLNLFSRSIVIGTFLLSFYCFFVTWDRFLSLVKIQLYRFFSLTISITLYTLAFTKYKEIAVILVSCLCFISCYLVLIQQWNKFAIAISYCICLCILAFKPTLLLPFVGRFLESSPTASFPAMQSLSVVYCILMFLMLFSLQKTARKNSIIPS